MSVLGLINLVQLEHKNSDQAMHNYFKMMQHSIHKLDETLKEILDYSRNARSALSISEVDICKMVGDSFERMKYMDGSGSMTKSVEARKDYPFFTDSYRLSVIINNLVSNAIKYRDIHKENHSLKVTAEVSGTDLNLTFVDNGIGIEKEFIPRIFEMFYRATERSEGAGLGLYIVRETVQKLHGNISVESQIGKGTTFRVTIPNLQSLQSESPERD